MLFQVLLSSQLCITDANTDNSIRVLEMFDTTQVQHYKQLLYKNYVIIFRGAIITANQMVL